MAMKSRLEPSMSGHDRLKYLHLDVPVNDSMLAAVAKVDGVDRVWATNRYGMRFLVAKVFDEMEVCTAVRNCLEQLG